MVTPSSLEAIQEFCTLAKERRFRQLPADQRTQMDSLEEQIREAIDGARLKPKRIENPSAAKATTRSAPSAPASPSAPSEPSAPSGIADDLGLELPSAGENLKLSGLADRLNLSLQDKNKVQELAASELPVSNYTPTTNPLFMSEYFGDDFEPVVITEKPKGVVRADGADVQLKDEVMVWFGLMDEPDPADPATDVGRPGSVTGRRTPRAPSQADLPGRPTIVHFVSGGTKRGRSENFDPASGSIAVIVKNASAATHIALDDVLAIFFGLEKGETATEPSGDDVTVTLVNEKQISGVTPDYAEGGEALTIIPQPRRGNIDRIWIPATSVKEIEM